MSSFTKARSTVVLGSMLAIVALAGPALAQGAAKFPPRPIPGPAPLPVFPKITQQTLANGIRLAVVENHTLPIVAVRIGFSGGAFLDAPGKEGGWTIMLTSLREGTTTRSGAALADASADLGTTISWSAAGLPSFTTIRSAWQPSFEIVADILEHPTFPEDGFKRIQSTQATSNTRPSAQTVAGRTFNATLFGPSHPYGRSPSEASIRSLTRDDIMGMCNTYLRPQNTFIVIAGDITLKDARAAVDHAFGGWERGGTTIESNVPAPPARTDPTTIYLRDDPGAPTATIWTGNLVPGRGSVDAISIEAVNSVLGGNTSGRMWQTFRVDRGLSYQPTTAIAWRPEPQVGSWQALVSSVPAAKADTAVTELVRVFRETHGDRPPTGDELDFARKNLLGALPTLLSTIDNVAALTLSIMQNGLAPTFYNDYVGRVNALTLASFQGAAAKYLDVDHMVIAVVGDRAKIEAPLRATGIPVVIVER